MAANIAQVFAVNDAIDVACMVLLCDSIEAEEAGVINGQVAFTPGQAAVLGLTCNSIVNQNVGADDNLDLVAARAAFNMEASFQNIVDGVVATPLATVAGVDVNTVSALCVGVVAGLEIVPNLDFDEAEFISPVSAVYVTTFNSPHTANVFCTTDTQCAGNREDKTFGDTVTRRCRGLGDPERIPRCNDFVALFTLRWLLFLIVATYIILLIWAVYWLYPWLKRRFGKKGARGGKGGKGSYSDQEQLVVNTLAAQCASSENLLLQATDMLKTARAMENVLAVEQKRESKIMIYVVQYFQATCSIMVALTHAYISKKANTPGENWNAEDATVRALQLEVLNYVRDRLDLALKADSMTEQSILRIAEGYAILKKITDKLAFVGFEFDKKVEKSLGHLKTPFIEFNEDHLFISGTYTAAGNAPGTESLANQAVCITVDGTSDRNFPRVNASLYLSNQQRDAKIYDPLLETVKPGVGKALAFNTTNQAQTGEGLQFFVRSFWQNEIKSIQGEAMRWLQSDGALETWLDGERRDREGKAAPHVKKTHKKKKREKGKKKKKKGKDGKTEDAGYTDAGDSATEFSGSEFTDASGYSLEEGTDFVFNISAVVNQGLGIAGKPGMPYDRVGEKPIQKGSKAWQTFEEYFPNVAEWPKFYAFIFGVMPVIIMIPMLVKARQGSTIIDIDGNVDFKARVAGFGISYLGVPNYYFLDGEVPELEDLQVFVEGEGALHLLQVNADVANALLELPNADPFGLGDGQVFMTNDFAFQFVNDLQGSFGRDFDIHIGEIQAGVLAQADVAGLDGIRDQQVAQEITTVWIYALMHVGAYFLGLLPLTLIRETLEILARRFPFIREIYPMSLWRELHMSIGLAGLYFIVFGATVYLVTSLVGIGKSTPFGGNAGDPNIGFFFDQTANVLYLRQFLLPGAPVLFLMKYAARGPPTIMVKYAPTIITKYYWEICYFLHYLAALAIVIVLVIYRAQVFYWMGATWGIAWGGNKIVRIMRTRKTTIREAKMISYLVDDGRNNAKKRSDVLRIQLNVPASFPSSARGQACWIIVPDVDYVAHPFTLAKVPSETDKSIMFHMAVRYLPGDDVISLGKPDSAPPPKAAAAPPPVDPNALPPGWKSTVDPNTGNTYYFNAAEQRTTWKRPQANAADKLFDGVRGITTRMSNNFINRGTARVGVAETLDTADYGRQNTKTFAASGRATWTQNFAKLASRLQSMDPQLRRNAVKDTPVYVSAPLGTSMDDALLPSLPGSIIITTQNGLPAAESSVRWLMKQSADKRPKFHFFVSVSRELNDALSVVETLRDAMCDSVASGHLNIEGSSREHAHMMDWLGVYIHLTRRKPSTIKEDRNLLLRSLNPPSANVTERQLGLINDFVKNRVVPGRLPFDRFLARTQMMVRKRCGADNMAVGYCGSAKVAYSIRSACRSLKGVRFDGEFI